MSDPRAVLQLDPQFRSSDADVPTRTETDGLGPREIPADAYWGVNVSRALENFPITGRSISQYPDLIRAFACVKQAAARANVELGVLDATRGDLIERACEELKNGALLDQFVVDIMQGGAGTSTNMNVNEVIANRGLELGGHARGDYRHLDPNDHVNRSQSTNDAYPTAFKLGLCRAIERLLVEVRELQKAFHDKGAEFHDVVKVGRTQLQDAVPMTLGQEFEAFAIALGREDKNLSALIPELLETNLGGTAIGTGIAAPVEFPKVVNKHLAQISGYPTVTAAHLVEATTDVGVFLSVSGALKRLAMKLSKISNDLRLLSSGPQAGINDINLPPRQAGSSIMPGKVNPVIPEVVNEVAFTVAGGDLTVTMAAEAGQFQLNAFFPVITRVLFENINWLSSAMRTLRVNCVVGITANRERLEQQVSSFVGVATALIPNIGYAEAAKLAVRALHTNTPIVDLVTEAGLMSREDVVAALAPRLLTRS